MSRGIVTELIGLVFGLLLVFNHSSMKSKGIFVKILVALFAGLGIAVLLNMLCEITGIAN